MIFYFSATGNSMYVARQIEENPISIPQSLQRISARNVGLRLIISM